MKNTTIILLLLVIAAGVFAYIKYDDKPAISDKYRLENERDFSIHAISDVHHIMIADIKKGTVKNLDKRGEDWIINDKYIARTWSVENLLNSLKNTQIRSIPRKEEEKFLIEAFQVNGIKVVLSDKDKKIINSFIIGPNALDGDATYFMKEGKRIYMVEIKNFFGSPRKIFQFDEHDYRSLDFLLNTDNHIEQVIVDYPERKHESFIFTKGKDGYVVERLYDFPKASEEVNQKIAKDYYREYDKVFGETYFPDFRLVDSLLNEVPFAMFTIISEQVDTFRFTLWPTPSIEYIKPTGEIQGRMMQENIPRFWVHTSDDDWLNMQVDPNIGILRGYSYFFN